MQPQAQPMQPQPMQPQSQAQPVQPHQTILNRQQ
jgi:hypothetical protein